MGLSFIAVAHFLSGLYSLILILIGTPLNLLCFYIYTRLVPNRSNPTIIVFAHLALIELLIPFTWNINYAVRELLWKYHKSTSLKNLEAHSLFVCKLISYSAYFSLQCAAWLKTLATFARCVSVHHDWSIKKWVSKPVVIRRMIWFVICLIALINFPILIINGRRVMLVDGNNRTKPKTLCYASKFFTYWEIVHLLLYNFIPFTLMILCNISIIHQVKESRRRTQRSKLSSKNSAARRSSSRGGGGRLTKTLLLITIFFITFTAPAAIFYIVAPKKFQHRDLITMSLSNLATTSHVTSFIIYWLISSDFRDAAISILFCRVSTPPPPPPQPLPISDERIQDKSASNHPSSAQPKTENERKLPLLQLSTTTD